MSEFITEFVWMLLRIGLNVILFHFFYYYFLGKEGKKNSP